MKISKRISAAVVALMLTVSAMPVSAFAYTDNSAVVRESIVKAETDLPVAADVNKITGIEVDAKDILITKTLPQAMSSTETVEAVSYSSDYPLEVLEGDMKTAYEELASGCEAVHNGLSESVGTYGDYYFAVSLSFDGLEISADEATALLQTLRDYNPQYYWIANFYLYALDSNGNVGTFVVLFSNEFIEVSAREKYNAIIDEKVAEYKVVADGFETVYEKVEAVHDKLISEVTYAYDESGNPSDTVYAHSVIGAFDESYGEVVCEGYSRTFSLVLNSLGIDAMTVTGNSYTGTFGGHAWNLVKLDDDNYYWFDSTWNDSLESREFFAVTDEIFSYTHFYGDDYFNSDEYFTIALPEASDEPFDMTVLEEAPSQTFTISQDGFTFKANPDNLTCTLTGFSGSGEVTVPSAVGSYTVDEIAEDAFAYNYAITSVTVPETVTVIRKGAFSFCTSLESAVLNNIGRVEESVFAGCTSLADVTLSNSINSIGNEAFLNCEALTEITLPNEISYVGERCFEGTSLAKINLYYPSPIYYAVDGVLYSGYKNVLVAFPSNYESEEYTIPEGVMEIGNTAFSYNESLREIYTAGVEVIGDYAFEGSNLYYADLSENVSEIGDLAFYECVNLGGIKISNKAETIGNKAIGFIYDRESLTDAVSDRLTVYCNEDSFTYAYCEANGINTDTFENNGYYTAEIIGEEFIYTGEEITPEIEAYKNGKSVTDFTVTYSDNVNCGTASAVITFSDGKKITLGFDISPLDITQLWNVQLEYEFVEFNSGEATPAVTVTYEETVLTEGTDFTVSYENNVAPGIATVKVTAIGNFTGELSKTFEITSQVTHNFIAEVVEPECEKEGYTLYTCTDCGATYKDNYVDALEHNFIKNAVVKPTVENGGYTLYVCEHCDAEEKRDFTDKLALTPVTNLKHALSSSVSIRLTWDKNEYADGYAIYKLEGSQWVEVATIEGNETTVYSVKGLASGTTYTFGIKAFNGEDFSELSQSVTTSTNPAVPKNVIMEANSSVSIRLAWDKVNGAQGYIIERLSGSKWVRSAKITNGNTTVYSVKGLASGTDYTFRVRAYRIIGGKVYYGGVSSTVLTCTKPATVKNVTMQANSTSSIRLSWDKANGANGYIIEHYNGSKWVRTKKITNVNTTVYSVKGLPSGTNYTFRIRAYKIQDGKVYYGGVSSTVLACTKPGKPVISSASSTSSRKLSVKWNKVSGAENYQIVVSTSSSFSSGKKYYKTASNSVSLSNHTSGTRYYIKVRAFKEINGVRYYGSWSSAKSVVCR